MKTYAQKLKDPRWQKKRLKVMERDNFTCRDCRADDKPLHVHHCHYAKGDPWDTPTELLLTLCEDCHAIRGDAEQRAKNALGRLLARLDQGDIERLGVSLEETAARSEFWFHSIIDVSDGYVLHVAKQQLAEFKEPNA